ncbi:MAG: PQQ-binding-like beta-propeller repeat protein, partial [bacterium]
MANENYQFLLSKSTQAKIIFATFLSLFIFFSASEAKAFDWTVGQGNNQHNADYSDEYISSQIQASSVPKTLENYKMPVFSDGIFVFSEKAKNPDRWLAYAVDKNSGTELWRLTGNGILGSSPTISGNIVLIPTDKLICLDLKSGTQIWQIDHVWPWQYFSEPFVYAGKVFVWQQANMTADLYVKYPFFRQTFSTPGVLL